MTADARDLTAVAAFGDQYRDEYLNGPAETASPENPFRLRFLLKRAFAGGRSQCLAEEYREAAETTLRTHEEAIRARWQGQNRAITDDELRTALEEDGVGNRYDREMVVQLIEFLGTIPEQDHDVIEYTKASIQDGAVDEVFDQLIDIHNIGPKKAAVYLRDVVVAYGLEADVDHGQCRYVFPVDTWVHRVGRELEFVETDSVNWRKNSASIIEHCRGEVSPIAFNQGAWYLGANAFDVILDNLDRIKPHT